MLDGASKGVGMTVVVSIFCFPNKKTDRIIRIIKHTISRIRGTLFLTTKEDIEDIEDIEDSGCGGMLHFFQFFFKFKYNLI
jgi:hypothetical protein